MGELTIAGDFGTGVKRLSILVADTEEFFPGAL